NESRSRSASGGPSCRGARSRAPAARRPSPAPAEEDAEGQGPQAGGEEEVGTGFQPVPHPSPVHGRPDGVGGRDGPGDALCAAMVPIATGRGPGAAARASMAKVILGGQLLSLLLSLLVTPVAYSLWDDLSRRARRVGGW